MYACSCCPSSWKVDHLCFEVRPLIQPLCATWSQDKRTRYMKSARCDRHGCLFVHKYSKGTCGQYSSPHNPDVAFPLRVTIVFSAPVLRDTLRFAQTGTRINSAHHSRRDAQIYHPSTFITECDTSSLSSLFQTIPTFIADETVPLTFWKVSTARSYLSFLQRNLL